MTEESNESFRVAATELRSFVERVEKLESDKQSITDDIKDVYGEAKGRGYDTKAIRTIVKLRKKDTNERLEEDSVLETYMDALGMPTSLYDTDDED